MAQILTRRAMLRGLLAMPAVVHAGNLMPISARHLRGWDARKEWYIDVALGYAISRKQITDNLYKPCPGNFLWYDLYWRYERATAFADLFAG